MAIDVRSRLGISDEELTEFCRKWKIADIEMFGSVLRDDFRPESDIDFLITFEPGANWSLLDYVGMEEEMVALIGRPVDMIERRAVEASENYIRRHHILSGDQSRPKQDDALLLDLLLAARHAISMMQGMNKEELRASELHQHAVQWKLGTIARSAQKASAETKEAHPQIPWGALAHVPPGSRIWSHYSPDRIWEMVRRTLPDLVTYLEQVVPGDPGA